MKYLNKPVAYLEDTDFDKSGSLIADGVPADIPVVIMIQAGWCPHCTTAKPAFQQFANEMNGAVFCATIQADGDRDSEKKLGERIGSIKNGFRGFPDYVLYVNGKAVEKDISGRGVSHLKEFAGV